MMILFRMAAELILKNRVPDSASSSLHVEWLFNFVRASQRKLTVIQFSDCKFTYKVSDKHICMLPTHFAQFVSTHKGWEKFDFVLNKFESCDILCEKRQQENRYGR